MRVRYAVVVTLACLAAAAASAQDSTPDPTPPHLYYPLAVGNVWEYANTGLLPASQGLYLRREIVRDTVVSGRRYFVEVRSRVEYDGEEWVDPRRSVVRFDTVSARVYSLAGDGAEYPLTCPLDGAFGAEITCWSDSDPDSSGDTQVAGGLDARIPFGPSGAGWPEPYLDVAAVKTFYPLGPVDLSYHSYYAAPIGYAGDSPGFCFCARQLSYARVLLEDGVFEVGLPYLGPNEPDINPAWAYDPIGVGNVRAYEQSGAEPRFWRTDSPTDVMFGDERWVVRRTQEFEWVEFDDGPRAGRRESRSLVRFDTTAANVLVLDEAAREGEEPEPAYAYPCRLDLPLPEGAPIQCGGGNSYDVARDSPVRVGDGTVTRDVRLLRGDSLGARLAAGIGEVGGTNGDAPVSLVYAVVDGDTLGTRPLSFPLTEVDPTPAWAYYPLAVGNTWEYIYGDWTPQSRQPEVEEHWRVRVNGTVESYGHTWFEVELQVKQLNREGPSWRSRVDLIRFDTLSARVVEGGDYSVTPCPFDEPANVAESPPYVYCSTGGDGAAVFRRGPGSVEMVSGLLVESSSFKDFEIFDRRVFHGSGEYAAGIGYLGYASDSEWSPDLPAYGRGFLALRFASVRQEDGSILEIGTRFDVAADDAPGTRALSLSVGPNPTEGPLALALDVPRAADVTLEAFDALGRRVWDETVGLGAGRQRVEADASRWASGLYVIRATADERVVTATVVRR